MSKELFQQYREEEIETLVSMPYYIYKGLKTSPIKEDIKFIKHTIPSNYNKFKDNKRWNRLKDVISKLKKEQKEIEHKIIETN